MIYIEAKRQINGKKIGKLTTTRQYTVSAVTATALSIVI